MRSITEKHTEKNTISVMSNNHVKTDKGSKKHYNSAMNLPKDDLSPELLEAHIVALLRNALS